MPVAIINESSFLIRDTLLFFKFVTPPSDLMPNLVRSNLVPSFVEPSCIKVANRPATGNQTAVNLHAWANQPGMPVAHAPEAHKERRAPTAPLTPEQVRAFDEANDHHEDERVMRSH